MNIIRHNLINFLEIKSLSLLLQPYFQKDTKA
jgi:hypothetical protein